MFNSNKHIIKGVIIGNVTQVTSTCPWLLNHTFSETFTYDASDQLVSASETNSGSYQLAVTYGNWGKINSYSLAQTDLQSNVTQSEAQAYTYPATNSIGGSQLLFAPVSMTIQGGQHPNSVQSFTFGINGSLRKTETHAGNHNVDYYLFNSAANLKAYCNNGLDFAYYGYNDANTRTYKYSFDLSPNWVNGRLESVNFNPRTAMFYPNSYLNFNQDGHYTKHYYNGMERIASRLGDQNLPIATHAPELQDRKDQLDSNIRRNIESITGYDFLPVGEEQNHEDPKHVPQGRCGSQFWR